ncbi:hypothetical protein JOE25_004690 [Serratia sp. PL17]|jgi:hypothetical protein|nr:hypothetical protein [Serratia sp. PL17]
MTKLIIANIMLFIYSSKNNSTCKLYFIDRH